MPLCSEGRVVGIPNFLESLTSKQLFLSNQQSKQRPRDIKFEPKHLKCISHIILNKRLLLGVESLLNEREG
jgi:hypothetical protein